jgi:preprotein translocase subunit SecF
VEIVLANIAIIIYIAWTFRKISKPIASWKYGVIAVIALVHDVFITVGFFAFFGQFYGIEINAAFIAAILTVLGYSVHDTIVVFDRTRENLLKHPGNNFEDTVENSVNQTLSRSINTSLTVMLTLFAILLFGGQSIRDFVLTLIIGVTFGTYSSIFLASPLLVTWNKFDHKS